MKIFNEKITLIAVMGLTGSGKSTFINLVTGSHLPVGEGLESCTGEVAFAGPCEIAGKRVLLIDTPGFDDTEKKQADVLHDIAAFLKESYTDGRKLTGIIYFHRISDYRVGGIARQSFRLFRKICGDNAMKNVVIVTNMWSGVELQQGESRERELATKSVFFKDALDHGASLLRHYNTAQSAQAIIQQLVKNSPKILQMQHDMVDQDKEVADTEAGKELYSELEEARQRHMKEIEAMQEEIRNLKSKLNKDVKSHREEIDALGDACTKLQQKVVQIEKEKRKLRQKLTIGKWISFATFLVTAVIMAHGIPI